MLIALSRLKAVLEVDLDNQRVVVEPGVTNVAVSAAVGPTHFYPPDPSSQIVCSIGGNVAENSGGAHCFKYGFTTNYVTGLEVVLPDGEVVQLGGQELDRPGYDLLGRVRGLGGHARRGHEDHAARGPAPDTSRRWSRSSRRTSDAGEAVSEIVSAGIMPGGDRDDGRARDPGLRADGPRRLSARRRRRPAHRARRPARGVRARAWTRSSRSASAAAAATCAWPATSAERAAALEDAQGRLPGRWAASPRTTSSRTASSRAPGCPRCCAGSTRSRPSTT